MTLRPLAATAQAASLEAVPEGRRRLEPPIEQEALPPATFPLTASEISNFLPEKNEKCEHVTPRPLATAESLASESTADIAAISSVPQPPLEAHAVAQLPPLPPSTQPARAGCRQRATSSDFNICGHEQLVLVLCVAV